MRQRSAGIGDPAAAEPGTCISQYWIVGGELFQLAAPDIKTVLFGETNPELKYQKGTSFSQRFDEARSQFYGRLLARSKERSR